MPFALRADQPPGRREDLGDVRLAVPRALGHPETGTDAGLAGRVGQRGDRRVVQADQPLRVSGRVGRPGQRHLREQGKLAARRGGMIQHPQVRREIPADVALAAPHRRQQYAHPAMVPRARARREPTGQLATAAARQ